MMMRKVNHQVKKKSKCKMLTELLERKVKLMRMATKLKERRKDVSNVKGFQ